MTVREAIVLGKIPEPFKDIFPKDCLHCGTEIEVDNDLNFIGCPNVKCIKRKSERAVNLLAKLGIKGNGPERMYKIFSYSPELSVLESLTKLSISPDIYNKPVTLSEFVDLCCIPQMSKHGLKIFDQWMDFNELMADIEKVGSLWLVFLKFFKTSDSARIYYNAFVEYMDEMNRAIEAGVFVNRKQKPSVELYIAITGTPIGYIDKQPYIDDLVEITQGRVNFRLSVDRNKLHYVVADSKERTKKYILGEELNILITSEGLKKVLKDAMEVKDAR